MAGGGVEAVAAYDVAGGIGWSAPAVDAALDAEEAQSKLAGAASPGCCSVP